MSSGWGYLNTLTRLLEFSINIMLCFHLLMRYILRNSQWQFYKHTTGIPRSHGPIVVICLNFDSQLFIEHNYFIVVVFVCDAKTHQSWQCCILWCFLLTRRVRLIHNTVISRLCVDGLSDICWLTATLITVSFFYHHLLGYLLGFICLRSFPSEHYRWSKIVRSLTDVWVTRALFLHLGMMISSFSYILLMFRSKILDFW